MDTMISDRPVISARFGHDMPTLHAALTSGIRRGPLLHELRSQSARYRTVDGADGAASAAPPSQFERIASAAAGISPQRVRLLGILLAAATPAACGGRPVLRPIWATEALHRAYNTVRLVARLEQNTAEFGDRPTGRELETRLGIQLAANFDALAITHDEEVRACSTPLRDVVRDLVELFGPAAGNITASTQVDRLALPAYRHRALVLLANELVTNSLLHAFRDRPFGCISVQLSVQGGRRARLTVTDDGDRGFDRAGRPASGCSVTHYLADLLESELVYRPHAGGGTTAEIEIPVV